MSFVYELYCLLIFMLLSFDLESKLIHRESKQVDIQDKIRLARHRLIC